MKATKEIERFETSLERADPEVFAAIKQEEDRQRYTLELIASENFTSEAVLQATGSVLTNKYAEGYPGRRYYGGCQFVDIAESLAIERAKTLFAAEHANVQPHSGSQANMAVYFSVLNPGDTILGMSLDHGGHLTHGHKVNFSGKLYNVVHYGVRRDDELIDYDQIAQLAAEHKPKVIVCGATAYPRQIDFQRFSEIAKSCGAALMADMAHIAGLVATDLHPSPVPWAEFVTSTTHKTLRGPRSGFVLCRKEWAETLDKTVMPGMQGGPLMHVIAAKAVCFGEALQPAFRKYQQQIVKNAATLARGLSERGYRLVSGGTENHLMLVDLTPKSITGKEAERALEAVGITVNKNMIPFDTQKPMVTSGIRVGAPAATTRGMKEADMEQIAEFIDAGIACRGDEAAQSRLRAKVRDFCAQFPMFSPEWNAGAS